jgi:hypothetical protein
VGVVCGHHEPANAIQHQNLIWDLLQMQRREEPPPPPGSSSRKTSHASFKQAPPVPEGLAAAMHDLSLASPADAVGDLVIICNMVADDWERLEPHVRLDRV